MCVLGAEGPEKKMRPPQDNFSNSPKYIVDFMRSYYPHMIAMAWNSGLVLVL